MANNQKYKKPPVVETIFGVQFPELEDFRGVHFGLYWQTLRDRYPKWEDQPRLSPLRIEKFPRPPIVQDPRLQLLQGMPLNRVWFTAKSDSELIQLQPDRFLFNWREHGNEYPSYERNSKMFFREFEAFSQFCRDQTGLSEPMPEICEVTYVNHIKPEKGESAPDLAGKVFSGLRWEQSEEFLPSPESLTFNRAFVIKDQAAPIGRLYAEASIAVKRGDSGLSEFVLFNLTGRVNHKSDQGQKLADSMQLAHDWVVRGFADLTNKQFQKERWGRQT